MKNLNLPRISDLPSIDLYKEQVLELLDPLLIELEVKPITSSMINNYTKHHFIPAPTKKKYTRKHVAHIIVIAILKDLFELSEIKIAIEKSKNVFGFEEAYNLFMDSLERSLNTLNDFSQVNSIELSSSTSNAQKLIEYASLAFALRKKARSTLRSKGDTDEN